MGYQESWLYVQPQRCFPKLLRAYEKTAQSDYYRIMDIEPMSVIILRQPFGYIPQGAKILWVCGDRGLHNLGGVFDGNLKIMAKVRFIPVEWVLAPEDSRLSGIDLDSRTPSENAYMKRYSVKDYAEKLKTERER